MQILEMEEEIEKNFSVFDNNCIWIGTCKFSQSWTGNIPSAVNVLTKAAEISSNVRGDVFQIKFLENDGKLWQNLSHGDLASIWDAVTCWLLKRVLKRHFFESGLNRIFTASNFRNTLAMTIILFSKYLKFGVDSRNGTENSEKAFRFSDNWIWIASRTFSQSWTRYLSAAIHVLTNIFKISASTMGEILQVNFPENDEKHDKYALMEILQVSGMISNAAGQRLFSNGAF